VKNQQYFACGADVLAQPSKKPHDPRMLADLERVPAGFDYGTTLGDFSQQSYQLTCLFSRLLCCAKGYIAGLCAPLRALQADENPAQSGSFVSSIRLTIAISSSTIAEPITDMKRVAGRADGHLGFAARNLGG
jgi:hypothetical protein